MDQSCLTCHFNNDSSKAPGGHIKEYNHWILEHINEPIPISGWLVLKTKRHTDGIVNLSKEESEELGTLIHDIPKILKKVTNAETVYVVSMTESVKHPIIHFIPRYPDEIRKWIDLFVLIDEVKVGSQKPDSMPKAMEIINKLNIEL